MLKRRLLTHPVWNGMFSQSPSHTISFLLVLLNRPLQVAVAVKRLYGKQEVQSQFIKEANSMCTLSHVNIIRLYGIVLSEPLMLVRGRDRYVGVVYRITDHIVLFHEC